MSVRKTKWNPRYVEYARAHGREPDAQQLHDREDHKWGGGFLHWSCDRLYEAEREIPNAFTHGSLTDPVAYDAWLKRWVDQHLEDAIETSTSATDLVS